MEIEINIGREGRWKTNGERKQNEIIWKDINMEINSDEKENGNEIRKIQKKNRGGRRS
jgi:hypothetical protein